MPHDTINTYPQFKDHFDDFVKMTDASRREAEKRRDYRDLKQWDAKQVATLESRDQAPIVFDQFGKKIDAITGIEIEGQTLPKAVAQTPKHTKASDPMTMALRFVSNNNDFGETSSDVLEDKIVEGYGAVIVEYNADEESIIINRIPWDRYYYDPHSRLKSFKDKTYDGITLWLDAVDAVRRWPDKEDEINAAVNNEGGESGTFDDRPDNWVNQDRKRLRVNQEYYRDGKVWMEVFYSGDIVLQEPMESPYLDCNGRPHNPIESECDYIDRDNNRYGWSQRLIDPQDEINHRRSKALFMLSNVSVRGDMGAFGDLSPEDVLDELSKGRSYLEILNGANVEIDRNQELGQAQVAFYQDALRAMDSVGINPELSGTTDSAISGRAFIARQQGGMREISRVMSNHTAWKRRVFEQVWARIKQFWDSEKWVRVTDNKDAEKFIGLNVPINGAEKLIEQQAGLEIDQIREQAPQVDQVITGLIQKNPILGETVEVRNNIPEMDMDIKILETPASAAVQQEQFDTLAQVASSGAPSNVMEALIKLSGVTGADEVIEMLTGGEQQKEAQQQAQEQQNQVQQALIRSQLEDQQAETQNTKADTALKVSQVQKTQAEAKKALAEAVSEVAEASGINSNIGVT